MMKQMHFKLDSQEEKENVKNTRKTLKVLQQAAGDKENLAGRPKYENDGKLASTIDSHATKRKKVEDRSAQISISTQDKAIQTGEAIITSTDLTSDEPSSDYWKKLAEKREELLNESFKENDRLKGTVDALQEENKICKQLLDESRTLVEVLQEMLDGNDSTELAVEAEEEP